MMTKPEWASRYEAYATGILDQYRCPGLAVGVAEQGRTIYFHGFGHRDQERQLPLTPDTVMGIASCTKSFTCAAIMQLQEQGKLSVHDPVTRYVPEFRTPDPAATRAVTIHHLMTHTAGLPPLPTLFHAMVDSLQGDPSIPDAVKLDQYRPARTYEEMLAVMAEATTELLGPPGTRFSYSNDGYALLGCIIERVSGMPYEEYIRERILLPAGMTRTTFADPTVEGLDDAAALYAARPKEGTADEQEVFPAPGWWSLGPMTAAGGLRSTVRDMLRYTEIYRNEGVVDGVRILRPESVAAMMTPYVEYHDGRWYGYGLQIIPAYHGVSLVEHGGSIKGVSSMFTVIPSRGLAGVVLNNLQGVPSDQILLGALNGALGLPLETRRVAPSDYPCDAETLRQYEGVYPLREGPAGQATFWVEDGVLKMKAQGGIQPMPETVLHPVGPHRFEIRKKETRTDVRFHFDGYGKVHAVSVGLRMWVKRPES